MVVIYIAILDYKIEVGQNEISLVYIIQAFFKT